MSELTSMQSQRTTFAGLFEVAPGTEHEIARVEIPPIQRDYAQGRGGTDVTEIRRGFLQVLHRAVTGGEPVGLDFIYGEVSDGAFQPLDGQQRLTTLFLMHWYLAFRAEQLDGDHRWKNFSYATRPGSRLFCQELGNNPPPSDLTEPPSNWVRDQPWYLHVWGLDPTVEGMLVVMDEIDSLFVDDDHQAAWERLVDTSDPAISFHLLPIDDMGSTSELYIKMNSRGKPLTPFENFKARFEATIHWSERKDEFSKKVDGKWSDLLWPIHGGDYLVDDEFMRYLEFVTELCEWQEDLRGDGTLTQRAERIFGEGNPRRAEHLNFLFEAFDVWYEGDDLMDVEAFFGSLFTLEPATGPTSADAPMVLHGDDSVVDLFENCCHTYGDMRGRTRLFPLSRTLLLYAILLHRMHATEEFQRRLRVLRNLLAASEDEIRGDRMPVLVEDVQRIILNGSLDVEAFNKGQAEDERRKAAFLAKHTQLDTEVFGLEDHNLLRGSLAVFDLTQYSIASRAAAFRELFDRELWPVLTGALLTFGEYHRRIGNIFQFGTGHRDRGLYWRVLFQSVVRSDLAGTRQALMLLLDCRLAQSEGSPKQFLESVCAEWLEIQEASDTYDWRYYLVRYDAMRTGQTGRYASATGELGFQLAMLNTKTTGGYYRDPYLQAVLDASDIVDAVRDPWFLGGVRDPRWLELTQSETRMRVVDHGFELQAPRNKRHQLAFNEVCQQEGVVSTEDDRFLRKVPQNDAGMDTTDRVQVGVRLLNALLGSGL